MLVFGCILSIDDQYQGKCPINGDSHACSFGVTIGVFSFIFCLVFLFIDARFDNFSNINTRKKAVVADMGLSGMFLFIFIKRIFEG